MAAQMPEPEPDLQRQGGEPSAVSVATGEAARIVLLGDLHLYRLGLWPWDLISKRILGQMNLLLNRRTRFDMQLVEPMVERIAAMNPHMLLCSGDLTMTALRREFEMARRMLDPLLSRFPSFIVPGNHDRYTFTAARQGRFEEFFRPHSAGLCPHVRPVAEGVLVVGLDAVRPNIVTDRGELGAAQLKALASWLDTLGRDERLIVLCHYTLGTPPGDKPERRTHAMIDADALVDVLARSGLRTLYVHGHVHRPWCWRLKRAPNVVAVNAGTPIMTSRRYPHGQGFWSIDISDAAGDDGWELTRHRLTAPNHWQDQPVAIPTTPGQPAALGL